MYLYIADNRDDARINCGILPESFIKRAYLYKTEEKRADSLRGYHLLNNALNGLGFDTCGAEIFSNEYGKPYIKNCPYFFSLSHSFGKSFCALGNAEVGCDVEKIRKIDLSVAKRFFYRDESDRVFSFSGEERITEFFKIWTLKESFMKAVSKGFSLLPSSFSVLGESGKIVSEKDGFIPMTFIKDGFCFSVFSRERV